MNIEEIKQHYFLNKLKHRKNGSSRPSGLSTVFTDAGKAPENYYLLRLQEMEELNACLEKLVEQRTKKLYEVIAANAKFISIIAHDLRSPFNSILCFLVLLKENLQNLDIKTIEEYIDDISNSTNKTLNLLESLLEWAISQNEEKTFNPVKIDLHELLNDEIVSFNPSARQKQITLKHFIPPSLNVTADLQMVKTVLRNLINNAIKFTNTGGEITIGASERKQFVEIAVKDNGIGISFETQRKLFKTDAFHSASGTNNEKGTGLGLKLCKEFVEMHGGNIRIKSKPGRGSEFVFTLPHYI